MASKLIPSRMKVVDKDGYATPEFARALRPVEAVVNDGVTVIAENVTSTPSGGISATNVQDALDELDTEKATVAALDAHITDAADAHDASAISNAPAGGIAATTVQAAINELDTDKEAAGTAAASMSAHLLAADPHPQYLTTAEGAGSFQPLDSDLTSWAGVTRAAGFDTFAATPSSVNLKALVTDETGSGALVFATSPTLVTPLLGTPTSGNLANCTFPTLNQSTTGSAATLTTPRAINGTNFDGSAAITVTAAAGTLTGATLAAGVTASSLTSFGAGIALGTPASGTLTNCTFPTLNQSTTGSAAKWTTPRALAGNNVDGSAAVAFANKFIVQGTADTGLSAAQFLGALATGIVKNTTTTGVLSIAAAGTDYVAPGGALGTPSSGTLTSCTGLPISTGVSGLGTNVATFLATPSSANLAAALTDETGTGANVFATAPAISTAILRAVVYWGQGTPTNKAAAATLTIAELLTGIVNYSGVAANLTMPIATDMDAGVNASVTTNDGFQFSIINTGSGLATLLGAAGVTLVGGATVAVGASGRWQMRKTGAGAWAAYRIA